MKVHYIGRGIVSTSKAFCNRNTILFDYIISAINGGLIMWIILGIIAILATGTNLYMYKTGKDYKLAMAIGLSFTALTLCAEYSLVSTWVKVEDISALLDVVPTMEMALWVLTIISIVLNIAPVLLESKNRN